MKPSFEVYQDPGNHKWFIDINGLMDTDAGYFDSEEKATKAAIKLEATYANLKPRN